jgi:hypothetical protein
LKLNDPNFSISKFDNKQIEDLKESNPTLKNRYLSSNYVPLTMEFHNNYGQLIEKKGNTFKFSLNNRIIKVVVIGYKTEHFITVYDLNGREMSYLQDLSHGNGFIRTIGITKEKMNTYPSMNDVNYEDCTFLYIEDYKVTNIEYGVKTKFLSTIKKEYTKKNKILTFDFECYKNDKNAMIPYACAFYDGKKTKIYYLTDYKDSIIMIEKMFEDIMVFKYTGYTMYAHNFNKFDSAFIFRFLNKKYKVTNIIPRNTGLLCFTVTHKIENKVIRIKITDSIALLPSSLASLGESFNVDVIKDVFPHEFVNESNLDYVGDFPDLKYFGKNISIDMIIKYTDMAKYYSLRSCDLNSPC